MNNVFSLDFQRARRQAEQSDDQVYGLRVDIEDALNAHDTESLGSLTEELFAISPHDPYVYLGQAYQLFDLGMHRAAYATVRKALQTDMDNDQAVLLMLNLMHELDKHAFTLKERKAILEEIGDYYADNPEMLVSAGAVAIYSWKIGKGAKDLLFPLTEDPILAAEHSDLLEAAGLILYVKDLESSGQLKTGEAECM